MNVKIKKLHPDAIIPTYATIGSACFDLYAADDTDSVLFHREYIFGTGLAFGIPDGHAMLVYSRSGHGFKNNVRLANCVGVVDKDYVGEVKVKLTNDGPEAFYVKRGDRIAQAMIVPVKQVEFTEVDELDMTERGVGGFGSTGR